MLAVGTEVRYRIAALFDAHWEEFVRTTGQQIRAVVFETVRRIRACRTPALGCHLYQCPKCQRVEVVPHSCKSRFCPTCGKHATDRWADSVLNDLLDVPYHHVVLSVPAHLRGVFAFNRPQSLSLLFRAATAALNQWARDVHGMRVGIVLVLHTFGSDLKWHPHLHLLVTEGGLALDGSRWVRPYGDGKTSFKTLPVLAFLGRLIRHIPDKHFKMVRYAGIFATRWRFHYLAHARAVLQQPAPPDPVPPPVSLLSWRERRQAEGTDPLLCPSCRVPMDFVRLVFGPHEPIAELFRAAGKPVAPTHPIWDTG